jgi:TetR/AcrR family transcriptional repressor of nem operon
MVARPREFDIDEALDAAMEAFWRHGYEGTSLTDLMDAMGLQKGSVYKAFGSKHELFIQVLKRYLDKLADEMRSAMADASSPADSVRRFIDYVRTTGYEEDIRKGCLAVNAVVELAPHDDEVRGILENHQKRVVATLTGVIAGGQEDGSFRNDVPAADLAAYLTVVAAGFVSTSKASFAGLDDPGLGDILYSTLQS